MIGGNKPSSAMDEQDARLAQERGQDDRSHADDDSDLHEEPQPGELRVGIERDRNRARPRPASYSGTMPVITADMPRTGPLRSPVPR